MGLATISVHETREEAEKEKNKLAKKNPSIDFYVLKELDGFTVNID